MLRPDGLTWPRGFLARCRGCGFTADSYDFDYLPTGAGDADVGRPSCGKLDPDEVSALTVRGWCLAARLHRLWSRRVEELNHEHWLPGDVLASVERTMERIEARARREAGREPSTHN